MLTHLATLAITVITVKNRAFLMLLCSIALVAMSSSPTAQARLGGREVDNGGDSLVYNFRAKGRQILTFLKTTSEGLRLANANALNLDRLEAAIAPGNVTTTLERAVEDLPRFDNNPLDGAVFPIVLVRLDWAETRAQQVFHAMLIAAGYSDRDGEISAELPESHLTD